MRKLAASLLLLISFFSRAQTDSLLRVFRSNAPDTVRAEAIIKFCMAHTSNHPDTCLLYADSALSFFRAAKLTRFLPHAYKLKGVANVNLGNYEESLKAYFEGLKIAEQLKNKKEMASILNNIGVNYWYQKSFEKAREYYQRSHEIRLELGNKKEIARSFNNLGIISVELKEFSKALTYYQQSLTLKKEIKDEAGIANCYNNMGIVYEELKDYKGALECYKTSLPIFERLQDDRGRLVALNNMANIYRIRQDFSNAELYAKQSLAIAKSIDDKEDVKSAFEILAASCYKQAKYKDAYDYLKEYSMVKDTLYTINKAEAMQEMESKYQNEKKEQQLQIQNLQIKEQQQEIGKAKIIRIALFTGLLLFLILSILVYNRYLLKKKANTVITRQKMEVEEQKKIVEEKNHEILDSIRYAKHIQEAILPHPHYVQAVLKNHFVLYKPKDIVSGDFYYVEETETHIYFAAVDCTGHGVPGAFISIVGSNGLSRCVKEFKLEDPGQLLDKLNVLVNETLRQKMHESRIRDGMDISLCVIDKKKNKLRWAGANNPLYYIRNGELIEIKGDGQPVGTFVEEENHPFTTHQLDMEPGDLFYVFTDGFADQFGGPKGKKFKYKQLKELLVSVGQKPMSDQKATLDQTFEDWRGNLEQIDDLCIIGYKA